MLIKIDVKQKLPNDHRNFYGFRTKSVKGNQMSDAVATI